MHEHHPNQHDNQISEGNGKLNIMMSHQLLRHDDNWYSPIHKNILQNSVITSYSWESFHLEARVCKLVSNAREIKSTAVLLFWCLSKYWDKANIHIPLWTKNSITPLIRLRCGNYCFRVWRLEKNSSKPMLFFVGSHHFHFFEKDTLLPTLECLSITISYPCLTKQNIRTEPNVRFSNSLHFFGFFGCSHILSQKYSHHRVYFLVYFNG